MRIALLHPSYWPEVRRGAERLVHDVGKALADAGHDVTLITSAPGWRSVAVEDGFKVIRNPRLPQRRLHSRYWAWHIANAPAAALSLLAGDYEVAHAFFPVDGAAAVWARNHGGPPVVFSPQGIPHRQSLVFRRYNLAHMLNTTRDADAVTALSQAAAEPHEHYLLRRPEVLPAGLFCSDFEVEADRAHEPTLICAASLNDHRKRAGLLLAAFELLRERRPDARLLLAGREDPTQHALDRELPERAQVIEGDRTEVLARAYARSWASVLPAVDEGFGLTVVESMAAGTPAVAARSGALPELVTSDAVGRLFEPDDVEDLARAMEEALDLSTRPETAAACRSRARDYDWSVVLPRYEAIYRRVTGGD